MLARVGRSLLETIDLDEQLGLTLRLAAEALRADRGSIMLADPETNDLVVKCSEGLPPEARQSRVPIGVGIAGWVAAHNQPLILHGDVDDARFRGSDPTIPSSLSLPLATGGAVLGVLNLVRRSRERFTNEDLRLAASLADLASVAIEKARLHGAVVEREQRVSGLLAALIGAQEQERQRLAADIHDGFLQDLSALFLRAEIARVQARRGDAEAAAATIAAIQDSLRREVETIRSFIFEVRPPSLDEVGLGPTLEAMVDRLTAENAVAGEFQDATGGVRLPASLETILYRCAQEALRNVVKHSDAGRVWVTLERAGTEATLRVSDDGRGISGDLGRAGSPGHFGVETMRERMELAGGRLRISRRPEGGTQVEAVVPIPG